MPPERQELAIIKTSLGSRFIIADAISWSLMIFPKVFEGKSTLCMHTTITIVMVVI